MLAYSLRRESNAILIYLVENYDTEHKISVTDPKEKAIQLQWLFFQASGQGSVFQLDYENEKEHTEYDHVIRPYFGQAGWFIFLHHEKLPSAIERYHKEILRVLGVLESVLSKQEWLVGGKPTIADISFAPWNEFTFETLLADYDGYKPGDFPAVEA